MLIAFRISTIISPERKFDSKFKILNVLFSGNAPINFWKKKIQPISTSTCNMNYFRNKFHFPDIHWSMNTMGRMQSKWCPKGFMLTLHRTHCIHPSMNVSKMKFISYIYTLFSYQFCSLFEKFWSKSCQISGEVKLLNDMFGYYIKQPSPWCDVNQTLCRPVNYFIYLWRYLRLTSR